ncbi:NAD(P)-dependent oxidoreductase [soil metagenome]
MERIACIGLGQMGGAIAGRLHAQGLDVIGFDASEGARKAFEARGARTAQTLAQAVEGAQVVITCLPNSAIVRSVWLGPDSLQSTVKAGTLLIDMSSIDPDTMRTVGAKLAEAGAVIVDCPVSGSPQEADIGKLILIAGGDKEAVDRARPILAHVGDTIRYAGGLGAAKVVKIANNMMSMANVLAASEAFALGKRAGVDPEVLFEILSVSGGRSAHLLKRFPWAIKGDYAPRFKMELGEKDLSLGIELGRSVGLPTPVASLTREMSALALAQGQRGQDIVAFLAMYDAWGQDS